MSDLLPLFRPLLESDFEAIYPIEQAAHQEPWSRANLLSCFGPRYLNGLMLDFSAIENLSVGEEKVLQLSTIGREAGDQLIRFTLHCDILSHEITAETSTFFFKAEK